jgi:hypothetical protein
VHKNERQDNGKNFTIKSPFLYKCGDVHAGLDKGTGKGL